MNDLEKQSSLAVLPELMRDPEKPRQTHIDDFGVPITSGLSTRIQHEQFPVLAQQVASDTMRVCLGEPISRSFAVLNHYEQLKRIDSVNQIEWSWQPDSHWQISIHRHRQGLRTSRGLFSDSLGWAHLYLSFPDVWPVYGLGEKTGELNKQGKRWSFWNSDVFEPHTESDDALYQSIPFALMMTDQGWMGMFLDNPGRASFDFSLRNELCVSVAHGALDLYVFSGETVADVIEAYTRLTGRPFLPPRWALGYHQSRHSYESQQQVREVVARFEQQDLPLDAIYLDIMYMNGYRVFTFNSETYGNAPELIDELAERGVRVVPIIDPGIKTDPDYRVFQEGQSHDYFVHSAEHEVWKGQVWPGEAVWPDFFQTEVRLWWQQLHRYFTDLGVQGFWNDMNEPAVFNHRMTLDADALHQVEDGWVMHESVHNAYGLLMSEATALAITEQCGTRPFVLTRAGYAGIQRSAAVWTGDNRSSWEHLRMSVTMLLNLGLSGVAFAGADIGGFMDDCRPELYTRWMQLGCFYPLMRNHCAIGQHNQEPWAFGEETLGRVRVAMHRRYKLLPYVYQLMRDAHETGEPLMRPHFWYDSDIRSRDISDQFFLGANILVAPILDAGIRARAVRLPPQGRWLSLHTDQVLDGGQHCLAETGLDDLPVFFRAGSIIPMAPYRPTTEQPVKELRLLVVDGETEGRILYRDDDGSTADPDENRYARLSFGYRQHANHVDCHLSLDVSHFRPQWQQIVIGVPLSWRGSTIRLNGEVVRNRLMVEGIRCKLAFISPSDWC